MVATIDTKRIYVEEVLSLIIFTDYTKPLYFMIRNKNTEDMYVSSSYLDNLNSGSIIL